MQIIKTAIEGLLILEPKVFQDDRGYFMEAFKESFFKKHFPDIHFIQDNESRSSFGVLRGLHFQKPPFEQTKLIRVLEGEILDVAVDLRKNSLSFGKWESAILSGENKKQFLVPKGFAHGFIVLSNYAIVQYKVDKPYNPAAESGIKYSCKTLNIKWPLLEDEIIVSDKDKLLDDFKF